MRRGKLTVDTWGEALNDITDTELNSALSNVRSGVQDIGALYSVLRYEGGLCWHEHEQGGLMVFIDIFHGRECDSGDIITNIVITSGIHRWHLDPASGDYEETLDRIDAELHCNIRCMIASARSSIILRAMEDWHDERHRAGY